MNKKYIQRIKVFISFLVLIGATLACRTPDALTAIGEAIVENCKPVERIDYEAIADILGKNPEIAQYPDGAVYEVCYIQGQANSIRMTDGKSPDEAIVPERGGGNFIYTGTYIGEFPGYDDSLNDILVNEIKVYISNEGSISGSAILHKGSTTIHSDSCSTSSERWDSYTFSGQMADDNNGQVYVNKTSYRVGDDTGCEGVYERTDNDCSCEGRLTITDGELLISCGGADNDCTVYIPVKSE